MESDTNEYSDYDDDTIMINKIPNAPVYPDRYFHINYAMPVAMGTNVTPVVQVIKEQMTGIPLLDEDKCHRWYK